MEDEDGYMVIDRSKRNIYVDVVPNKVEEPSKFSKCWKIALWVMLGGSIILNISLIVLLIVFQIPSAFYPSTLPTSCGFIPGISTDGVTFDPETANRHLVLSRDQKTVTWGKEEQSLPDSAKRFDLRMWVLGQKGFQSGKHCWEVEIKREGEWCVGVARESVRRKGSTDFSTTEGIWGIGEYSGKGNFWVFTAPRHTKLPFKERPRRIRVFMDYLYQQVEFFNVETNTTVWMFSNATFAGERIYPWFQVSDGMELTLHP